MYHEFGEPHHRAHFHAYYGEHVAVYTINPVDLIAGSLPQRQHRLVTAWAELHQQELQQDCELLQSGRPPFAIEPLSWAMSHLITKVTAFEQVGDYVLQVRFDDETVQRIDFLPVLTGDLFAPLRDKQLFAAVRLDPECHTLVWPNGADFDPATLHDWPAALAEGRMVR